jgi:hypothetical protein
MKISNKYTIIFSTLLLFFAGACSDSYFDINSSETKPSNTSLPPEERIKATIENTLAFGQARISREVNVLSFHITERTSLYSRWTWSIYSFSAEQFMYGYALPNTADLIVLGEKYNSPHFSGVGKILRAYMFSLFADVVGDIILDDAYDGVSALKLTPKLNSQKEAYQKIHALIDDALEDFSAQKNEIPLNIIGTEVLYDGDLEKWKKFAWTLKARLLNHMSAKTSGDMKYDPAAIIAACQKGMTTIEDDAKRTFTGEEGNNMIYPWSDTPGAENGEGAFDARADNWSEFFINNLKDPLIKGDTSVPDPRLELIVQPALGAEYFGLLGLNRFNGVPMGIYREGGYNETKESDTLSAGDLHPVTGAPLTKDTIIVMDSTEFFSRGHKYGEPNGLFYTSPNSSWFMITATECKFIEAEAKFRSGDNSGAFNAYKEAIKLDMQKVGVEQAKIDAFLLKADEIGSANLTLAHIMVQKHIALVFNPESWVDMRRCEYDNTYPNLKRARNIKPTIFPSSGDEVDGKEIWIRALKYDKRNVERNGANLPPNDEASRFPTRVWWNTPDADDVVTLD